MLGSNTCIRLFSKNWLRQLNIRQRCKAQINLACIPFYLMVISGRGRSIKSHPVIKKKWFKTKSYFLHFYARMRETQQLKPNDLASFLTGTWKCSIIWWRRICVPWPAQNKFPIYLYREGLGIILTWAIFKNHSKIAPGKQTSFVLFVYFKGLFQSPLAGWSPRIVWTKLMSC